MKRAGCILEAFITLKEKREAEIKQEWEEYLKDSEKGKTHNRINKPEV